VPHQQPQFCPPKTGVLFVQFHWIFAEIKQHLADMVSTIERDEDKIIGEEAL
jgi:hypothetical protein